MRIFGCLALLNRECAKARRLLEVAFVLFLTGCGAGVAPERDYAGVGSDAPVNWVATKEGRAGVDGDWVRRFGESRLTALVDEAVMANPNMRVAEERVKRAALVAQRSQGGALPQASAGLNGNRNKQVFVGLPIPGATGPTSSLSTSLGASLNVSWEPDIWGKVAAENSAELARLGGEEQAYRAARSSLAAQVAKAWFALGEANEQLRLAYESLVIRQKTERAIEERFEQSLESEGGTAAQYRLAKTDTASAKGEIERWKGEVELAKRQLELLVGRYPEGKAGSGGVLLPSLPAKPPVGLPSELLMRRPDVLEAERKFAATRKSKKAADLARFPTISLTSSAGRTSSELGDLLDSDFGVWSLAGNLTAPILTGGVLKANYEIARSDERAAMATLQRTVLDAFGEVEQALVRDDTLVRRLAAANDALVEAKAADEASGRDYADGVDTILTVLQARGQRIAIASQVVTLRRLQLDNRVDLHLALGGDFQVRGK